MKRKTNVQVVKQIMEFSNYGPIAQLFVMDALSKFAEKVSKADPAEVGNGLISGEAWVGVAKEIKQTLDTHFAS